MNYRTLLIALLLMATTTIPAQARAHSMAHAITSVKQGLKFYMYHPVIWGKTKHFTPTTLTAAIITGAIASYMATKYYEQDSFDVDKKTEDQQALVNKCVWLITAGLGAASGAIIGRVTHHTTETWALYGSLISISALMAAELYSRYRSDTDKSDKTAIATVSAMQLPKALHSTHIHTFGDLCTNLTLLGITSAAGIGANWLLEESPDIKRSAVAGIIGGIVGHKVYEWIRQPRSHWWF